MKNEPRPQMTLKEIRAKAKALGYKITCNSFSMDPAYVIVRFIEPSSQKPVIGNVYPSEFLAKHKAIFDYLNSINGVDLTCRGQRVLVPL